MTDSPDNRRERKLTPERAAVWMLGAVLMAVLVFAIVVAVVT
jgi:hypothetical protein